MLQTHHVGHALNGEPPCLQLIEQGLGAGALRPRAAVGADEEPAARSDHPIEEPLGEFPAAGLWQVHELRTDEVKAPRRLP